MNETLLPQHQHHPRQYQDQRFVYPVLSRRSKGISIGINLNPDKICNFHCVYCQVDRQSDAEIRFVETPTLLTELEATLDRVTTGALFHEPAFASVPTHLRRLNDIAFSGDGEPTTVPNFSEIVTQAAALKRRRRLNDVKLVLITNASMFHRPAVQSGVDELMANQGEIWAKLDAGTAEYYQLIDRARLPFTQLLDHLLLMARRHPLVIQTLFLRWKQTPPTAREIDAYIGRLQVIQKHGGRLKLVQIYTVARAPAAAAVSPLTDDELAGIVARVQAAVTVPVEGYPGARPTS